jgi:hypothetical protein
LEFPAELKFGLFSSVSFNIINCVFHIQSVPKRCIHIKYGN